MSAPSRAQSMTSAPLKQLTRTISLTLIFMLAAQVLEAQPAAAYTRSDERYKADILLIVAHPDDETGDVAGYLARAIFDEHRRVAVIYTTRGEGGKNAVGNELGNALGAVREIEARRALAFFGVTNVWFLDAHDTGGTVLRSLEFMDHGSTLAQVVRLVRLTRPEVIVTWLPLPVAGENHGDHQAASVIANEAFDLAGDPTAFAEQTSGEQQGAAALRSVPHFRRATARERRPREYLPRVLHPPPPAPL
jgi:LmbE family N-acetylglucosaminyl deacetylase